MVNEIPTGANSETTADPAAAQDASPSALKTETGAPGAAPGKVLSPEARRALEEAELRRKAAGAGDDRAEEMGGPSGEEPTRYGDWERKGIAVDF